MALEQKSVEISFFAAFLISKVGATGLTVTVDVYNPAGTKIVSDGAATELGTSGCYRYSLSGGSTATEGEYIAVFKTTSDDVPQKHIFVAWSVGRAGVENFDSVDGYTPRQIWGLLAAALLGKVSGGPGSPVFRSADDAANRIASTSTAAGNRTAVTLTPPAVT